MAKGATLKLRTRWVVFVTAPDQITGEMWCSMIRASGVNCRLRDSNPSFIGPSLYPVRLMAPEDESELALQVLENDVVLGPLNAVQPAGARTAQQDTERALRDEPTS